MRSQRGLISEAADVAVSTGNIYLMQANAKCRMRRRVNLSRDVEQVAALVRQELLAGRQDSISD